MLTSLMTVTPVTNNSEDGSDPGQGTSTGYMITVGHRVSPPGNPAKEKAHKGRPARRWRDELNDYWKVTIWQRMVQDNQLWKQHDEAFAHPRDTMSDQC